MRVLLAFSGGIDSCAAVEILRQQGHQVVCITLDTFNDTASLSQARDKAAELNVELVVSDVQKSFKSKIIDYFISSYSKGETPAPCTLCNPNIKWSTIYDYAVENGFDRIATGHYFNITERGETLFVTKAADGKKDQSYYLWGLPQHILRMAVTPMGAVIKEHIKQTDRRKESMGICFLRGKPYIDFIKENSALKGGKIVNRDGDILADHQSIALFTIGQKRGVPASMAVVDIDSASNSVIVGQDKELYSFSIVLRDIVVPQPERLTEPLMAVVRGIGRNPQEPCSTTLISDRLHVKLTDPAWALAKGQPVVLYSGQEIVAGGFVEMYF